jgi:CHRD domain
MKRLSFIGLLAIIALILAACPATETPNPSETFTLSQVGSSGISGTAKYEKLSATETKITLALTGANASKDYPAHIHVGDIPDAGAIYVELTAVDGATGNSETTVTKTKIGDAITYEQLLAYDGYINVHEPDFSANVVQGETGKVSPYTVYTATLSGADEVPPVTDTTATGSVTAKLKGKELSIKGKYENLSDAATGAHIHGPGAAGTNAGVVLPLTVTEGTTAGSGTLSGTITLTDAQIAELEGGLYYVNVHAAIHASGEIRGQLE